VADRPHQMLPFPAPSDAEAAALLTVRDYLTRAGTHVASRLLGCPPPGRETEIVADLSESMLSGAALCSGLLDLTDEQRRL
jgi:hypothetical protein